MKKRLGVISFILLLSVMLGCSRTVTQIVTYGSEMVVEVTLRGTVETTANHYFLVLSSSSSYRFPLPPPDNITYEFIEPGTEPRSGYGSAESYYTNYYSSWSGYVFLGPGGYELIKGPFVRGQVATRESLAALGQAGKTLTFNFRLEKIFGSSIPDNIYFNFIPVSWPTDAAKFAKDYLSTTNPYISKLQYQTVTISDGEETNLDAALDVVSCKVTIQ